MGHKGLIWLAALVSACGPGDGPIPPQHTNAELARCQLNMVTDWAAARPTTGVGSADARAQYAAVLGRILEDYRIPGGAVAVSYQGRLVLALGIGIGDGDGHQPAHPDQLFRIASLSKQITATAIMHLVEDGQLTLDERVFDAITYDPLPGASWNDQLRTITIRQLLTHSGGWNLNVEAIRDPMFQSATIAAANGEPGPADPDMIIRYMIAQPLTYAPGTVSCYSNFGYSLLGRVIEEKSGMSYDNYVKTRVLAPAGITDMAIGRTREELRADNEVKYYPYRGEPLAPSVFPDVTEPVPMEYGGWYLEAMDAHGGWIASPVDMIRFMATIDGQSSAADQLTATSEAAMVANPMLDTCKDDGTTNPADPNYWYGFGLNVNSANNSWHFGSLDGTVTEAVIASNGFSWTAFFNRRPNDVSIYGRLDRDLWIALQAFTSWTSDDLYRQYPPFGEWTDAGSFETELASRLAAGEYPSRLEGRDGQDGLEYRARFAPLLGTPVPTPRIVKALDCIDYQAAASQAAAAGEELVSLQSFLDDPGDGTIPVRRYQAVWSQQ